MKEVVLLVVVKMMVEVIVNGGDGGGDGVGGCLEAEMVEWWKEWRFWQL